MNGIIESTAFYSHIGERSQAMLVLTFQATLTTLMV